MVSPYKTYKNMAYVKIVKCRNKFFWYNAESLKKVKDKIKFKDFEPAPDERGIVVSRGKNTGFVFHGDYRFYK